MSEYYKIIKKIECISTGRYCVLRPRGTILFQRLLPKLGSQAHFNTMCFSFAAKMAADISQLKELREFLHAGNEDSAKRLIQTLNPSRKASRKQRTAFRRSSKGKIRKYPYLSRNENHGLKTFYALLYLK